MSLSFDAVEVRGFGMVMPIAARYSYEKAKSTCPACGGCGIPWRGWFSCESETCGVIALVKTGEAFKPVP